MECQKIQRWFTAYVDGDLTPAQRRWVDAHLDSCHPCREELNLFQQFDLDCHATLGHAQPTYSFAELREKMTRVDTLEELQAFLPKLRINHAIPRAAMAFVLLLLGVVSLYPLRQVRTVINVAKTTFQQRHDQWQPEYMDTLDQEYRALFLEKPENPPHEEV
jgi:anti-sigma factor RsiW